MRKEIIDHWQGVSLVVLFIVGESLGMQTASSAGRDIWLAILLGALISFPVLLIYARLHSLFPEKDLIAILQCVFGKFLGKFIGVLYTWYFFHTGAWVLRNNIEYPITVAFFDTPKLVFSIFIMFLCIWIVKKGIEVLARWSTLFFIINSTLIITLYLMLIPKMDISNINPILYDGINPLFTGALHALAFPFGETVVFLMILSSLKQNTSYYKVYTTALLIAGVILFALSLISIAVIGENMYKPSFFPIHELASRIKLGNFFQRLEMIGITATFLTIFLKISVYLLAACKGVSKLFNIEDYRFIITPIGLIMCNFCFFGEDSIISWFELLDFVWLYYSFPFQVIIPIILLITAEIKVGIFNKREGET